VAFTISFNTRFLELKLPAKNLEISELNLVSLVKKKIKNTCSENSFSSIFYAVKEASLVSMNFVNENLVESSGPSDLGKLKTVIRNSYLPYLLDSGFVLLHAVLIEVYGKHFLIAGTSGSGKSTYAKAVIESLGGRMLANDYVVCKIRDQKIFASDINFEAELKHEAPVRLDGIFVCSIQEKDPVDLEILSKNELADCLYSVMNNLQDDFFFKKKFLDFWCETINVPFFKINVRRKNISTTTKLFIQTLKNFLPCKAIKVGVIGTGSIGAEICSQLVSKEYLDTLMILNRSKAKQRGLFLDFTQAAVLTNHKPTINECFSISCMYEMDAIFICIRTQSEETPISLEMEERMRKASQHVAFIKDLARELEAVDYKGKIFIVTNPVELLTRYLAEYSQQSSDAGPYTNQIYGVGLELDKARALVSSREILGQEVSPEALIQHGDYLSLHFDLELDKRDYQKILALTKESSPEIRKFVARTVYGPAFAAIKTLESVFGLRTDPVCVSFNYGDTALGGPLSFQYGVPNYDSFRTIANTLSKELQSWKEHLRNSIDEINSFYEENF